MSVSPSPSADSSSADVTATLPPVADLGRVAVLFGGTSAERPVSLKSGQAVLDALVRQGVDAHAFDPLTDSVTDLTGFDRAFIVLHGRGGEDGQIQGLLEWLKVPYTGSGVLASALGMDKVRTKRLWMGSGLPTAPFTEVTPTMSYDDVVQAVGSPFILKPSHEGSSIGMSKVTGREDWQAARDTAFEHDANVMAEAWITGREYTIVVLNGRPLPVIRLQPPEDVAFYDFDAKYNRNDTHYGIPSGLSKDDEAHIQALALRAFEQVGAQTWGRIDAMQDEQGRWWLLEINTVPGMTDHSLVPMAAKAAGYDFDALCRLILSTTHTPSARAVDDASARQPALNG